MGTRWARVNVSLTSLPWPGSPARGELEESLLVPRLASAHPLNPMREPSSSRRRVRRRSNSSPSPPPKARVDAGARKSGRRPVPGLLIVPPNVDLSTSYQAGSSRCVFGSILTYRCGTERAHTARAL
jgi:hypothetical protein